MTSDPAPGDDRLPSRAGGPALLAIPGPSMMPPSVLAAMGRQMTDIYRGELLDVSEEVFDALPRLARTTATPFVAVCNGHGAWEMALTNTLSRGDKVLVFCCGGFATGWGEGAAFIGLDVEIVRSEPGRAVDPAVVEERLRADASRQVRAILVVQVDTASSIRNDLGAIRAAIDAADHPALLMVDAIASFACERYEMDAWGIDVTVAASQKGLMTPPGLGIVLANERALAAHATADLRSFYWDWSRRLDRTAHYLRYAGTPPVSLLLALREAIQLIDAEGLEAVWARHAMLAGAVRAAVETWSAPGGLGLYARVPGERANSVTTVVTGTIDVSALRDLAQLRMGVTLGLGLGLDRAGASFRIGHMGHLNAASIFGVLGVVETALDVLDAPRGGSGLAAAGAHIAAAVAGRR